jgi:hypothetical protein
VNARLREIFAVQAALNSVTCDKCGKRLTVNVIPGRGRGTNEPVSKATHCGCFPTRPAYGMEPVQS